GTRQAGVCAGQGHCHRGLKTVARGSPTAGAAPAQCSHAPVSLPTPLFASAAMKPWTTLILGGYGNFGARIARALAGDAGAPHGMTLLVTGRDAPRANALAQTLGPAARGVALDHQAPGLADTLRQWGVDLVIHT